MATAISPSTRVQRRRAAVMAEALDHAVALMTTDGVGALSVSEVARRMGIRGPSLYKYFPSRHALYDALFARALELELAAVATAVHGVPRGVPRIHAGGAASVAWAVANPALAQLLHWRPVPGFEPSPAVFAPSVDDMAEVGAEFTVVLSGLISQQLANQPGVPYAEGVFSRLTDTAIDQFLSAYAP
jgi:AcrR family transcriptional regulator